MTFDDKGFLERYAAVVTDFGNTVNNADVGDSGYGIWQITEDQAEILLQIYNIPYILTPML